MRTKIVKEGNLVGFHLIQARRWKMKIIPAPSIDLTGCGSPKDLVKHNIGLGWTLAASMSSRRRLTI